MKKVVLKLAVQDEKDKQRALKRVSGLPGVDSISLDMKEKKLTLVGDIDPVSVVSKLKKLYHPEIVSVGPAKEEPKKDQGKDKKDAKPPNNNSMIVPIPNPDPYQMYNYQMAYPYQQPQVHPHHYFVRSAEEDPNSCVIC